MNTTNETTCSLSEALARAGMALTAANANKVLHAAKMIEKCWRESSKAGRPPKAYWVATALGQQHGIVNDQADPAHGGDPVIVRYVGEMLPALWAHDDVQATLAAMINEGTIKQRQGAQEAF
jgi:hypothetical protein